MTHSMADTSQYLVEVKTCHQGSLSVLVMHLTHDLKHVGFVCLFCCSQHLTTFVMDRKDAMLTIDDGIRKLRLLDAKGKVWTQEMLLQVDDKAVSLIDADTKVRQNTLCSCRYDITSFTAEISDRTLVLK